MEPLKQVKSAVGNICGCRIRSIALYLQVGEFYLGYATLEDNKGKLVQVGYLDDNNQFVARHTYALHEGLEAERQLYRLAGVDVPSYL